MQRRAARRWLAVTGIAAALVVSSAVSAAAEPAPTLGVAMFDTLFLPGSPGTLTGAEVSVSEPMILHNVTVKYDLSGISAVADAAVFDPYGCTQTAEAITCVVDEMAVDEWFAGLPPIGLAPKAGAVAGAEGDLKVTVSADGIAAVSDTAKVSVGEGVNLAAEKAPDVTSAPGGSYSELLGVQNVGNVTAHGAVLLVDTDLEIEADDSHHSNCTYDAGVLRMCEFDTDIPADKSYGATFPFKVRTDAIAPRASFASFTWVTPAEWAVMKNLLIKLGYGDIIGQPGTGPALALTAKAKGELEPVEVEFVRANDVKQIDEDPQDNSTDSKITINGDNPADVAAVGDSASGAAGTVVEVELGAKNNGPASITPNRSGDGFASVEFTVPPGATVTEASDSCYPRRNAD